MPSDSISLLGPMLKWIVIWSVSSSVLLWRVIDFIDEALHEGFHATRAGLAIFNDQAAVLQLLVIIICLALFWSATHKIIHLIKIQPPSP